MLTVMKHVSDQGTAQVCWRDRIDVLNIQVDEPVGRESIFLLFALLQLAVDDV